MIVSIIIPVYNANDFILDCLNSVAAQTMTDGVECILIEDCGQDNSVELIEDYIARYNGFITFRLFKQERNQGPSAARNRGIRESRAEYVFFLDADDLITPCCIEQLYTIAKENKSDYVQGTYKDEPKFPKSFVLDDKKKIKTLLLDYTKIQFTPHNRLVRRQLILDHNLFFNEKIKVREDFLWMTFVAKYVDHFALTTEETYVRGYNADSLTHNINREREILGYKVLIETMCNNIDPFLIGLQKERILDAFLMAERNNFFHNYEERSELLQKIKKKNNRYENLLLTLMLKFRSEFFKTKIHHILLRYYKRCD